MEIELDDRIDGLGPVTIKSEKTELDEKALTAHAVAKETFASMCPTTSEIDFNAQDWTPNKTFFEECDEISKAINPKAPPVPRDVNFVIQIRALVEQMLIQLGKIGELDSEQMRQMKEKYTLSSTESADLTKRLGNSGLYISGAALVLMLSQFGFTVQSDRDIMKFLSEQAQPVGGMFTSRLQSNQQRAQALTQLLLAEYNAKVTAKSSDAGAKNEVLELLRTVLQLLQRSSSQQ